MGNSHHGTLSFARFSLLLISIYPFRKFDPSSSNSLKAQTFGEPDGGGSLQPGIPISVAQKSSLISLIA